MSPDDLIPPAPDPAPEQRVARARVVGRPNVAVVGPGRSNLLALASLAAAMMPMGMSIPIIPGRRVGGYGSPPTSLPKHPTPTEQAKIDSSAAKRERQQLARCTPCPQCNARGPLQAKSLCTSPDTCELRKLDRTLRGLCRPKDWNDRVRQR